MKHGLTGAGVVVPEEDMAEVERRVEEFQADLSPRSSIGRFMIRQMATLSVRFERSAKQESAAAAFRVRHAAEAFDQARLDEADRLLDLLGEEPRAHLRKLRSSPEGVEKLIEAWQGLRDDLTRDPRPIWTAWHRERAENLTGLRIEEASHSEIGALSKAAWGQTSLLLEDDEEENPEVEVFKGQARAGLIQRIDAEIADLEAHYQTLDFETIERDRAGAPDRALFDPSRDATLARRYESEASRGFYKALDQFRKVEAEAAEAEAVAATLDAEEDNVPLASSRERPVPTPRDPRPTAERPHPSSDRANFEPVERSGSPGRAASTLTHCV